MDFKVVSKYSPAGDQPKAIKTLADGILNGDKFKKDGLYFFSSEKFKDL